MSVYSDIVITVGPEHVEDIRRRVSSHPPKEVRPIGNGLVCFCWWDCRNCPIPWRDSKVYDYLLTLPSSEYNISICTEGNGNEWYREGTIYKTKRATSIGLRVPRYQKIDSGNKMLSAYQRLLGNEGPKKTVRKVSKK